MDMSWNRSNRKNCLGKNITASAQPLNKPIRLLLEIIFNDIIPYQDVEDMVFDK